MWSGRITISDLDCFDFPITLFCLSWPFKLIIILVCWLIFLKFFFMFIQTPCCNKVYTCRFCHDEKEEHTLNRKNVDEIMCSICETKQPVQQSCSNCGILFGQVIRLLFFYVKFFKINTYQSCLSLFSIFVESVSWLMMKTKSSITVKDAVIWFYFFNLIWLNLLFKLITCLITLLGICRVGGRDKFFHCEKCDMCLPKKLENQHRVLKISLYCLAFTSHY